MKRAVSIEEAVHYLWGEGCDGWHLLRSDDLSVIQERVPPGAGEVAHLHRRSHQFFLVLEGEGTMALEDQEVVLPKGTGIEIGPGVRHRFCNRSSSDVIFVVISAPPAHGDRVES